jgi:multidrug resistance efflux pump
VTRAVTLAGVIALVVPACDRSAEVGSSTGGVRTARVTRGELADRVLLTGELEAGSSVELSVPRTDSWQLTIRWLAEDGALVKAGDRVLEFDNSAFTSGLEQKRIAAAEVATSFRSTREISALAIAVKEHEVAQHRITLAKATLLANVPADLLPQRTAQERRLEKARAEAALARGEKELVAERQAATLDQKVQQLALDKAKRSIEDAEKSIGELTLTAPRDGLVLAGSHPWTGRPFKVGDTVQPGMRLLSMPDVSEPMKVRAELSDVDDGRLAVGAAGTCTLDAYPLEPIVCKVVDLAPVAGNSNRESLRRAFAVKLSLATTANDRMRPGMSVRIEITQPSPPGLVLAPRGAVVFGDQAKLRVAGGALRPIKLGSCDAQRCVIDQGAAEGDAVELGP